ncbi:MAG: TlpA disulfide reductase family protein [Spirochaetales bacterium]
MNIKIPIYSFILVFLLLVTALSCSKEGTTKSTQEEKPSISPVQAASTVATASTSSLEELFRNAGLSYMGNRDVQAPTFSLQSLGGNEVNLKDFLGKVVVLNFWATWCPPCRAEMPSMETLHKRYENKSFKLLAVNLQEELPVVQAFLKQNPYTFTILMDPKGNTAPLYGIRGIPTTFIINENGKLLGAIVGAKEWDTPQVFALFDALLQTK